MSQQIKGWKGEIVALERKIALALELMGESVPAPRKGDVAPDLGASFMGAIVQLANGESPMSRSEMRNWLEQAGFPKSQIAQQFNTVLYKAMKANRVSYQKDGRVWKGEKK